MTHIRYPDVRRNLWHVRFPSCAPLLYVYLHASLYKSYCGWFHILLRTNTTHTLQWSTVAQKSSALYFFFWDSLSGCKDEWMRRWSVASGGGNLPLTPFFFLLWPSSNLVQAISSSSSSRASRGRNPAHRKERSGGMMALLASPLLCIGVFCLFYPHDTKEMTRGSSQFGFDDFQSA